ncbi:acetyltransferase [Frankia sp. BMG5.11]|uniref:acetyltransferase n=1 Tax=Parafrankia sp. BMG5.11 TaxID=222540 RepID=UPI00103EABB5|nr:acetyltransferase [Parafrankia sp. BMG5.11]
MLSQNLAKAERLRQSTGSISKFTTAAKTPSTVKLLDIHANRAATKWTLGEQCGRVLWGLVAPLFRLSPRPLWCWRRVLLRLFGANVARGVHVFPTVRITIPWNLDIAEDAAIGDRVILYALGQISIGSRSTISQGAHLCAGTHDIAHPSRPLVKAPVKIGSDVWVCADAFVGPGVDVGDGAIVGARAVAMKNVPAHTIVAGNPARQIRTINA